MNAVLEGGTINKITGNGNGHVIKEFINKPGIDQSVLHRLAAEAWALSHLAQTGVGVPTLFAVDGQNLHMSYVPGIDKLDEAVYDLSPADKESVHRLAGRTLRSIHGTTRFEVGDYHNKHKHHIRDTIGPVVDRLKLMGIHPEYLYDFLVGSYNREEVETLGITVTHGDYWLNNIRIGSVDGVLQCNGVIDWELAQPDSPYRDFGVVELCIERSHPEAAQPFWESYGYSPDTGLKRHYAILRILQWMGSESPDNDLSSGFYQDKLQLIRESI